MRSIVRAATVTAAVVAALLALAAPAAASSPSATLVSATITFYTENDDKAADLRINVGLLTAAGGGAAVTNGGITGSYFPKNSTNGPFALTVTPGVRADTLNPARLTIGRSVGSFDTWTFGYELKLVFSDTTQYVYAEDGHLIDQHNHPVVVAQFVVTTHAIVPDVIGLSPDAAKAALAAEGLNASVTHEVNKTCDYVGVVWKQTPQGRTIAVTGTTVALVVGDKPKTCL